jgi:hypothetical protein
VRELFSATVSTSEKARVAADIIDQLAKVIGHGRAAVLVDERNGRVAL